MPSPRQPKEAYRTEFAKKNNDFLIARPEHNCYIYGLTPLLLVVVAAGYRRRTFHVCRGLSRELLMNKRKAFTLIELLVVIAIIALLLAILTPALSRVKKQAKKVICLSNLRQIGTGALVYSEEHNGFLPRNTGGDTPWIIAFMPYLGGEHATKTDYREIKIYSCPSFPTKGTGVSGVPNKEQTVDYVLNSWMDDATEFIGLTKLSEFRHPHSTIYMADNEDGSWRHIVRDVQDITTQNIGQFDVWHPDHRQRITCRDCGTRTKGLL